MQQIVVIDEMGAPAQLVGPFRSPQRATDFANDAREDVGGEERDVAVYVQHIKSPAEWRLRRRMERELLGGVD